MPKPNRTLQRSKRQHYVPRLHLRRFISNQPKNMVWTYDKERGTARPSRVEETACQSNFYSVRGADGVYNDMLDIWLQGVESDAASPYEELLSGSIPSGQAKADFAVFVSSLYVRSPALIRANAVGFAQFTQHMLDVQFGTRERFEAAMNRYQRDTGVDVNRDKLFAFWNDKTRFTMNISHKSGLGAMSAADELTEILFNRHWYIVEPTGGFFITGDSPVFRFAPLNNTHPFYGDGGFKNPAAEITMPLSPTSMLLITGQRIKGHRFAIPEDTVWELNRARAYEADRFLYAHLKDDHISKIAAENKDRPERFKIDGAGPFAEVRVTR